MKDFLEKRFRHRTWFKEGVTVGFALDYFAKTSDFYLNKKPALKQSGNLLDAIIYDDTITDGRSFYRLSEEEKQYYLERKEYWKEQRELEHEKAIPVTAVAGIYGSSTSSDSDNGENLVGRVPANSSRNKK